MDHNSVSRRVCVALLTLSTCVYLMLCGYLPTDSQNQGPVDHELHLVLNDIKSIMNTIQPGGIIICGDFQRNNIFVRAVDQFVQESQLHVLWNEFPIDYTYRHSEGITSTIDHFLVSANIVCYAAGVIHSVEDIPNIAHSAVWCEIKVDPFCEMPNQDNMFTRRFA